MIVPVFNRLATDWFGVTTWIGSTVGSPTPAMTSRMLTAVVAVNGNWVIRAEAAFTAALVSMAKYCSKTIVATETGVPSLGGGGHWPGSRSLGSATPC